jgi:putative transposase
LEVSRSVARYQTKPGTGGALRQRRKDLAERYPRYGYPTLHAMMRHEEW